MTTLSKNFERQYPLVAQASLIWSDAEVAGVAGAIGTAAVAAIDLPANAVVLGGYIVVDTVWVNAGGTATVSLGDTGAVARYNTAAVTLKTAALTALVPTGHKYTAPTTLNLNVIVATTAASAGTARAFVEYVIDGRGNENFGPI